MNTKIIIGLVGAVILIVAGFFIYKSMGAPETPPVANTATSTAAQVQAQEISIGTGAEAVPGATVSVLYIGQLEDGTIFDSSEMHNNAPYTFVLGSTEAGSPIAGFQIGVNSMKEGGERIMTIPASLAYGEQEIKNAEGKVIIPSNATLIFNVKLVKVSPPAQQ